MMLPYISGIFTAILPCLAYDSDARRNIKETATAVNFALIKLVAVQDEIRRDSLKGDSPIFEENKRNRLELGSVVKVLTEYLMHNSVQTKVAVLQWIHHLHLNIPKEMHAYFDVLFPALQRTLSDPADEVVQQCLVVIAEVISSSGKDFEKNNTEGGKVSISKSSSPYYSKFVVSLLNSFRTEKALLEERGSFIIRQLCLLLNAEDIYLTLAEILLEESHLKFAGIMVEHLNMILLTSSELFELRTKLKDLNTKESCDLFCRLYKTWCHNPVATVALCLLTQYYRHVCELIRSFGNLEVTVDFLIEIDKLVQLIESPIFAYLRLELLEVPCDQDLIRALYGLLMLLPQSDAFHTLKARLSCIPSLHLHCNNRNQTEIKELPIRMSGINFQELLEHFVKVQERHHEQKKQIRTKEITSIDRDGVSSEP